MTHHRSSAHVALVALAYGIVASAQAAPLQSAFDLFVRAIATNPESALRAAPGAMAAHCRPLPSLVQHARVLAATWRGQALVGAHVDGDRAEAQVGPVRPSMITVCFRRDAGAWAVVGWVPGE
ncbi:MAG: hypothetical protein WCJ30_00450 [Deltaproteobacteria bacterium]